MTLLKAYYATTYTMKNAIITVMLLCGLVFAGCKKKKGDIVAYAMEERARIEKKLKEFSIRQADDVISKEKGALIGYFDGDVPQKVSSQNFGSRSRTFRTYYFSDGMLILVEEQRYVYNMPVTYTEDVARAQGDSVWYDDSKTVLEKNYYYLDDNQLVKWIDEEGHDIPANNAEFVQMQPELLSQAIYALKQLEEK
ncbi:hypothetical protein GCM10023093_28130 [Nemorincola caseinilytica]|uniref:DUF4367 domain-containing protein n=1 Tax=Nemorincola caseinilytica TaxID=2054315 RepID=A0ABP8NQH7_9BACT